MWERHVALPQYNAGMAVTAIEPRRPAELTSSVLMETPPPVTLGRTHTRHPRHPPPALSPSHPHLFLWTKEALHSLLSLRPADTGLICASGMTCTHEWISLLRSVPAPAEKLLFRWSYRKLCPTVSCDEIRHAEIAL